MGRINGHNSDYAIFDGQIGPVEPAPNPLFLKLFICPHDQPNRLEPLEGASSPCEGQDDECPHSPNENQNRGHAMLHLHQSDGAELAAGRGNRISLAQSGNVSLETHDGHRIELNASTNQITLEVASGARIVLRSNGDIDLDPASGRQVRILGNAQVTGNLTVSGSFTN